MPNLNTIIKQLAKEAIEAEKGASFFHGTVKTEKPLSVMIDQKLLLDEDFLILMDSVTDYEAEMSVESSEKRIYKIHNHLKAGEGVVLARMPGGQQFIVLGRG